MRICVAQTKPVKGDIPRNIDSHKKLINLALSLRAGMIIFPELSITGYEPELANTLAIAPDDPRLTDFQKISDTNDITIGVGAPLKSDAGTLISMLIFQPHQAIQTYSKQYLHSDELPYFVSGQGAVFLTGMQHKISLAICYELSVPEHSANASLSGADIYIASVAKSAEGMLKAGKSLAAIAKKYSMTVLLSNCIGHCDNFDCGGNTGVWNDQGLLQGQLNDSDEGILVMDTDAQKVLEKTI